MSKHCCLQVFTNVEVTIVRGTLCLFCSHFFLYKSWASWSMYDQLTELGLFDLLNTARNLCKYLLRMVLCNYFSILSSPERLCIKSSSFFQSALISNRSSPCSAHSFELHSEWCNLEDAVDLPLKCAIILYKVQHLALNMQKCSAKRIEFTVLYKRYNGAEHALHPLPLPSGCCFDVIFLSSLIHVIGSLKHLSVYEHITQKTVFPILPQITVSLS